MREIFKVKDVVGNIDIDQYSFQENMSRFVP